MPRIQAVEDIVHRTSPLSISDTAIFATTSVSSPIVIVVGTLTPDNISVICPDLFGQDLNQLSGLFWRQGNLASLS